MLEFGFVVGREFFGENTPSGHTSFDGETDITDIEKTEENSPVMHINIL